MPGRDRTGPTGEGPMTGRGLGPCGRGQARGYGSGRGLGLGRGYAWRARSYPEKTVELSKEDQKKVLEQELKELETEKQEIENRLKEFE